MQPLFPTKKRTVTNGFPSNDLVLSAHLDGNDSVFSKILSLYVEPGSIVADVTYGKGVFGETFPKACTTYVPQIFKLA